MEIKYLGHSCFIITINSTNILIDPFISGNPHVGDLIDTDDLKVDHIFLTHGHGDHVMDAEGLSIKNGAPILTNFEIANYFTEKGCEAIGMNIGGIKEFSFGRVRMTNAIHSSSLPDGSYGGHPGGFLITTDECTLYISGDTALTGDMELIPKYFNKPDVAILPVGGFFTMDVADALIASNMIQCDHIIGCHFDTFAPIKIDHNQSKQLFNQAGKSLYLPAINEVIKF